MKHLLHRAGRHATRSHARTALVFAGAAAAGAIALTSLPARAQVPPGSTTTTSSTTTSTTIPGSTTTSSTVPESTTTTATTVPAPPTTTTVPPGPDPGAGEEIQPAPVPNPELVVPAPTGPYADQQPLGEFAGRVVSIDVLQARAAALGAHAALASARAHRQDLEAEVAALETRIRQGSERYLRTAQRLAAADLAMREQAVEAYVMGGLGERRCRPCSTRPTPSIWPAGRSSSAGC